MVLKTVQGPIAQRPKAHNGNRKARGIVSTYAPKPLIFHLPSPRLHPAVHRRPDIWKSLHIHIWKPFWLETQIAYKAIENAVTVAHVDSTSYGRSTHRRKQVGPRARDNALLQHPFHK